MDKQIAIGNIFWWTNRQTIFYRLTNRWTNIFRWTNRLNKETDGQTEFKKYKRNTIFIQIEAGFK